MIGYEVPVTGHSKGVMTDMRSVMLAVTESDPASDGPPPLLVALVTAAPFKQWKVTLNVAPASTDPAGVPLLELSSAAWLATVMMAPLAGGIAETTVTATGPLPVSAQMLFAVLCWYEETAIRRAWRTELVTASR